jgi:hypothetical protein
MPEFARPLAIDKIGAGITVTVTAGPEECAAIAGRLLIPSVESLRCEWVLSKPRGTIVDASGSLRATLHQECVVSLDAFAAVVSDEFTVRFVVAGSESDAADDPEQPDELPYEGTVLDLGEAAVEQLALALDPYPRKPGAELPEEIADNPSNPFDALAKWRTPN